MAIAFRSKSEVEHPTTTITKPAGVVDGDVLILFGAQMVTAGWTHLRIYGAEAELWVKVASSEPSSYSLTMNGSVDGGYFGVMLAYSGVDSIGSDYYGTGTSAPSITPPNYSSMIVRWRYYSEFGSNNPFTSPSGYTQRFVGTKYDGTYYNQYEACEKLTGPAADSPTWGTPGCQESLGLVLLSAQLNGSIASASSILSGGFTKTGELAGSIISAPSSLTTEIAVAYNSLTGVVTSS